MAVPMFSIIVVSLNAGEKLLRTIESIRAQTYTGYEVIVKDGGSRDGSVEALRRSLREPERQEAHIRILEEKDSSIYDAMNQAVEKTSGRYLYFLNCGDYFFDAHVLEELAGRIEEDRTGALLFYGNIYDALRGTVVASNPKINGFACYRNVPCHQACIYDRKLFAKRGYEPKYRVRADYEHFLYSFYRENAKPCYLPVTIASYEGGGFSETKENRERSAREHKEITAMYMSAPDLLSYRLLLLLTLAPLRTRMAESRRLAGIYNRLKDFLYGKK